MPASKPVSPVPKPPRAGRETSWGMMDIMTDIAVETTNPAVTAGDCRQQPNSSPAKNHNGASKLKTRTIKMAARATASVPPARIGRESSWGCVDVMEMLDLDDQAAAVDDMMAPPPMPAKGKSFALKRSTSRGTTSRPAMQAAQLSPKRL